MVDVADGYAAVATLSGDARMPLEIAAFAPQIAGQLGFPAFTGVEMRGAIGRGDPRPGGAATLSRSAVGTLKTGESVAASP